MFPCRGRVTSLHPAKISWQSFDDSSRYTAFVCADVAVTRWIHSNGTHASGDGVCTMGSGQLSFNPLEAVPCRVHSTKYCTTGQARLTGISLFGASGGRFSGQPAPSKHDTQETEHIIMGILRCSNARVDALSVLIPLPYLDVQHKGTLSVMIPEQIANIEVTNFADLQCTYCSNDNNQHVPESYQSPDWNLHYHFQVARHDFQLSCLGEAPTPLESLDPQPELFDRDGERQVV